jgi:transposase
LSGIIFVNRNGLRWRDAPKEYGPHKTLYSRWKRWSEKGIFARMMADLAAEHGEEKTVMIDATYLKAHRTATSMAAKKGARSSDRSHQRRHEHQAARNLRQSGTTDRPVRHRGTGQRILWLPPLAQ